MLIDMEDVLLHLCTPADWRAALASGSIAPPSLGEVGFVHLSTADQVELPAQRLFAGRRDMVLLAVDARVLADAGIEVRWEPGVPGDPESMRFPHAYGAIPSRAVLAVLPYRPGTDGRFARPDVPVLDVAGRATLCEHSVVRRAASREEPVTGGLAVLTDGFPVSRMHNQLLLDRTVDATTLLDEADRVLDGQPHRAATLLAGSSPTVAAELAGHGWEVEELVTMAAPAGGTAPGAQRGGAGGTRVDEVDLDALRPHFDAAWRRTLADVTDGEIAQLVDRYRLEEAVIDMRYLAVRDTGEVAAGCLLKIDGATASVDSVETGPSYRGRGHGRALLACAFEIAAAAGCDLLVLSTSVDDWPRQWYARLGFVEVGRFFTAART